MRNRIMVVLILVLGSGWAVCRGQDTADEWDMRVHSVDGAHFYALADVDSVTFHSRVIRVPAGHFVMGDGASYCGVDEHEVTLTRDFYLGRHPVTNKQFMKAVQWAFDNGYVTAAIESVQDNLDGSTERLLSMDHEACEIQFDASGVFYLRESPGSAQSAYPDGYNPADHPVKEVSWYGAVRYCDWLSMQADLQRAYEHAGIWTCNGGDPYGAEGYRLPTDAEWEYAAQYDDERISPWGFGPPNCDLANFYNGSTHCVGWTSTVGSYPEAPAGLGLWDMAGNIFEWCNDWWICDLGPYLVIDPTGPQTGTHRVARGGSWNTADTYMRCAWRENGYPGAGYNHDLMGFRIARTVGP
ncbi:formylglycine-generating enzyme family protein [Candidatus Eisenbacteria bacterium]|uniref:Formylglycine-generating enzyme family protein n=1 Tax=Eiseniibacteriota bacterium TaxID=2212470 RepID=A0ABV6YLE2_UNCEI